MGIKKREIQRRWWRISIVFGIVILIGALVTTKTKTLNGAQDCRDWASVESLIPPVQSYDFDSTEWNTLDVVEFELDSNLSKEAYRIVSDEDGVKVYHGLEGDHRAQSTLGQLGLMGAEVALPWGEITDEPVFSHRGVLLDVCRHFFTVDEVKRHLDIMALYKFNVLHWHLTEDQGWRIAMNQYPKLAEVAAFRMHGDSTYGGSYSREDLEEVVNYAASYGIEVIPEIEMPGHSQAALAAYPELGCTGRAGRSSYGMGRI